MIDTTTFFTEHGFDRAKERCKLKNRKEVMNNMCLAFERGKRAEDFSSWERNFLTYSAGEDCVAIAYNNYCYIFSDDKCFITVYKLPAWFGKKKHFNGKERIRDYKKYCKNNQEYYERCFCM